jgi:hypothetical protein
MQSLRISQSLAVYSCQVDKGQVKLRADWHAVDSPEKRMNKFFFFAFLLFTASKTNSFFFFWENLQRAQSASSFI